MSEQFSNKCQIYLNDNLGRYVKAAEAMRAGETLLLDKPILIIACNGDKRCSNCFRYAQQYCSKCQISPLCLDCQQHGDLDCNQISNVISMPNVQLDLLKKHPESYGILKCLLLYENRETSDYFEAVLKLESHQEKRRNTAIWHEHNQKIVQPLLQSNITKTLRASDRINEEFLQHLCGLWDVNCFEIRAPDSSSMRALYLNASLLCHDCNPNCNIAIDDQYRLKIYANRDIAKEEMATNCYTNVLLGTDERRHILREGKYFDCTCDRCEDPTELGSHLSSFICAPCAANNQEGFIVKNRSTKVWTCLNCNHTLKNQQVETILEKAKEEVFHSHEDLRRLEYLLAKLSTLLHRNHYIMLDIKQTLASILRSIIMGSLQRPGRRLYERKVRLCQELVLLLHIIQPGISRLKGIAIYEMANASAELYRLRFGEKELSVLELQESLRKCEAMFKEAIRMLLYEPNETPEGQLVKGMMGELKDLRNDIELLDKPAPQSEDVLEE